MMNPSGSSARARFSTPVSSWIAALLLVLLLLAAIAAPWIAPFDPAAQLGLAVLKNAAPSLAHPFGTDSYSRDLLSRALHGARASLLIALVGTAVAGALALLCGVLAGGMGERTGDAVMSLIDAVRAIPRKIILLAILLFVPQPTLLTLALLLGATSWTALCRVVYVQVRELNTRDFVTSAFALGVPARRVLARHVVPHLAGTFAASSAVLLADMLAVEAGLSFLGLGVRPPQASWGSMLQDGIPYLGSAWWIAAVPSVLLVVTVLSLSQLADAALSKQP